MAVPFDFFIGCDGPGLNGMIGPGGIARARFQIGADGRLEYLGQAVKFYPGLAGGHAVQIRPDGKVGYVGNFSQQLCFFDPRSDDLAELARLSTLHLMPKDYELEVHYRSQTHVIWLDNRYFLAAIGPDLWKFDFEDLAAPPEYFCPHGVIMPHGMKLSASGEYLCIGSKDSDKYGWSRRLSIIRMRDRAVRTIRTQETVWHLERHPEKNLFYANTQVVDPQRGTGEYPYNFTEYSFGFRTNYVYEIDAEKAFEGANPQAAITGHAAFGADEPHHLTSDLVVAPPYLYCNHPASSTIVRLEMELLRHPVFRERLAELGRIDYIDERVSLPECWTARIRETLRNLLEVFTRAPIPQMLHAFFKALRVSRASMLDGGYGLQMSPDGRYLFSAHRGRNEVYAYDARTLKRVPMYDVARGVAVDRVSFPPYSKVVPSRLSWTNLFWDPRLGFHHSALSVASAQKEASRG